MPNPVTVKITGLSELEHQLNWMLPGKAERLVKEAVAEASKVVTTAIANEAPAGMQQDFKRPGAFNVLFRKGLTQLGRSTAVDAVVAASTKMQSSSKYHSGGPGRRAAHAAYAAMTMAALAIWVEFGHYTFAGLTAAGKKRGKKWQAAHGAKTPANPFFTRGWELSKNQALNIFTEKLKELCK